MENPPRYENSMPPSEKATGATPETLLSWEQAVQWLRDQPEYTELTRACYFDDPLVDAADRFCASSEWQAVRHLLPSSTGKALDLGAGRGISSYALAREGWDVTALEPDPSPLVGAQAIRTLFDSVGLPISICSEYSEELPFPNNSFDLVNARQVLHHAQDLSQTCREIFRVLKPGGYMIATREHVISKDEDLSAFYERHPLHKLYGGENAFRLDVYLSAISNSGLQIRQTLSELDSPINYYPLTLDQALQQRMAANSAWWSPHLGRLFSSNHLFGRLVQPLLLYWNRHQDKTPGRLYSFVAVKAMTSLCAE